MSLTTGGPGSCRVLGALCRYLSLILKHSDTKRNKRNIFDNVFVRGGGGGCCIPAWIEGRERVQCLFRSGGAGSGIGF